MGFAIGIIIGSVSGNLALWIALGCGFGAAIGSFFTMSKGKKQCLKASVILQTIDSTF